MAAYEELGVMDEVFKALADPSRRRLLDRLNAKNGQTLRELCAGLDMARQSVSKHLAILEAAGVVTTTWRGREKLHYLNAAPINAIADRWLNQYDRARAGALADLQKALENDPMESPVFSYTSYINTTPERLWQALTEPEFTRRYWGGTALGSDWKIGSSVTWQFAPGEEYRDLGQVVLESDPYRRLSYSWHGFQPEHQEHFSWTDDEFAQYQKEGRSKVTFDIEPTDGIIKLTVTHDDFDADAMMHKAVSGQLKASGGWPDLLSDLKTFLETGEPLPRSA